MIALHPQSRMTSSITGSARSNPRAIPLLIEGNTQKNPFNVRLILSLSVLGAMLTYS